MRGRKPGVDQAMKGHPGKRRSKVERRLEEAQALAEKLSAKTGSPSDGVSPPAWLEADFPLEISVWREFAPQLTRLNILRNNHRLIFAGFCVHFAQWIRATNELKAKGPVVRVKGTNNAFRDRISPWFEIQKSSWNIVLDLSERFGLDPMSGHKLFREMNANPIGGLFETSQKYPQETDGAAQALPARVLDIAQFDSIPPDSLN